MSFLQTFPVGVPVFKAGRPVFHRLDDVDGSKAKDLLKVCKAQLVKMADWYKWTPDLVEHWETVMSDLDVKAVSEEADFDAWFPEEKDVWIYDIFPDYEAAPNGKSLRNRVHVYVSCHCAVY
jgi:hypothetical protein